LPSLYAEYIAELTNGFVYETDQGFASYIFPDQSTCYIKDIYVKPEFRRSKVASDISASIEAIAKQRGCTRLLGSVTPSAKNATISVLNLLTYGFKVVSASNDFILFEKDL
jgi:GNAT superfamily N-acetyltransferase